MTDRKLSESGESVDVTLHFDPAETSAETLRYYIYESLQHVDWVEVER